MTSTVYEVADQARVLWGGTAGGITGIHEWIFEETDGSVHVTTRESFAGDAVAADPSQHTLDQSLAAWLAVMKARRRPKLAEAADPKAWSAQRPITPGPSPEGFLHVRRRRFTGEIGATA